MDTKSRLIHIPVEGDEIQGDLHIPKASMSIVVFAMAGAVAGTRGFGKSRNPGARLVRGSLDSDQSTRCVTEY